MPELSLELMIRLCGLGHLLVLVAAGLVPFKLDWRRELGPLPRLHRQMYLVYGGYVVYSIVAFAALSLLIPAELAGGSLLARVVCGYVAVFWGVRLCLQAVFDVRPYLKAPWMHAGYHGLTLLFLGFTVVFGYAALR